MALLERYFSTAGAGAADGTSWANRAAFLSAGVVSTIITGNNFTTNGMRAWVGPGTYTITTGLATGGFANPPAVGFPLIFHGCDSSGVALSPITPGWKSNQIPWSDSTLPVFATTTNIATMSGAAGWGFRLISFTASGRTGGAVVTTVGWMDWCAMSNSSSNASAVGITAATRLSNSKVHCSGSIYSAVINGGTYIYNNRITGVAGSSGNRDAINQTSTNTPTSVESNTIIGVGGRGWMNSGANVGVVTAFRRNMILNCGGKGIELPNTAAQTNITDILENYIANCTGTGIDAQSAAFVTAKGNRLRDNGAGGTTNFAGFGNWPTDLENYTTDSDDATELADSTNLDYSIKLGCPVWGKGYGPGDQLGNLGLANMRAGMMG